MMVTCTTKLLQLFVLDKLFVSFFVGPQCFYVYVSGGVDWFIVFRRSSLA